MTIQIADRMGRIKPSATLAVNSRANELRAAGKPIINLSVGEPDFDTPELIKAAGIQAIEENFTRYTPAEGILPLREAIANKLQRDNQLTYDPADIMVSNGLKHALYNLCQAVLNDGDEVIVPVPYWVSYPAFVYLAGAKPVFIESSFEQKFKITAEQLKASITDKTRLFFLNSPSNPSGMAYTADELRALGEVLKQHPNVLIACDDIYEYILWSTDHYVSLLNVCPELKAQTVIMNGVSKAHAMTGWRIGYSAGPTEVIKAMKKLQSQDSGSCNSIAQKAAITALNTPRSELQYMFDAFKERHDLVYAALSKMQHVRVHPADGTFYIFADVSQAIKKLGLDDDIALATHLLEQCGIALVPGTAFGMPGYIRISCATSNENLQEAIRQFQTVLD